MSRNRRSKRYHDEERYHLQRDQRKAAKAHKKSRKVVREMSKRDKKVTDEHGKAGHGSCGRKKRYRSRHGAETYIRWHPTKGLSAYKCEFCGGWHLTSHPRPVQEDVDGGELSVRDVLELAREAAMEIRRSEEDMQLRLEAIGPQGYSIGPHSKNGILDPMRKVDDLIDAQSAGVDLSRLQEPIDEAYEVMSGIERVADSLSVEVATRYVLQAESWRELARSLEDRVDTLAGRTRDEQVELLRRATDAVIADWEKLGVARLKEMGR